VWPSCPSSFNVRLLPKTGNGAEYQETLVKKGRTGKVQLKITCQNCDEPHNRTFAFERRFRTKLTHNILHHLPIRSWRLASQLPHFIGSSSWWPQLIPETQAIAYSDLCVTLEIGHVCRRRSKGIFTRFHASSHYTATGESHHSLYHSNT